MVLNHLINDSGKTGYHLALRSFTYRSARSIAINGKPLHHREKSIIEGYQKFIQILAKEFLLAREKNQINLRPEIDTVQPMITTETGVITTNWDELLWYIKPEILNLVQLHGSARLPETLLLPTEYAIEEMVANSYENLDQEMVRKCFRSKDAIDLLKKAHIAAA